MSFNGFNYEKNISNEIITFVLLSLTISVVFIAFFMNDFIEANGEDMKRIPFFIKLVSKMLIGE